MSDLIIAARRYLGVRFRHRGRSKNRLDCAGLVKCAYADCGVELPDFLLYGREPHRDGLTTHMTAALGEPVMVAPVPMSKIRVADVVAMRFEHEPHHVALIGDYLLGGLSLIHADGWTEKVIEQRLTAKQAQRITHLYRRPV